MDTRLEYLENELEKVIKHKNELKRVVKLLKAENKLLKFKLQAQYDLQNLLYKIESILNNNLQK